MSAGQKQLDTFLSGEINQEAKNELSDQKLQSEHLNVQSQDAHDKEMMDIMFKNDLTHKNKLETLNQKDDQYKVDNNSNYMNVEQASPEPKDIDFQGGSDIDLSSDDDEAAISDNA